MKGKKKERKKRNKKEKRKEKDDEWKKEKIPSEQRRVSDPPKVVDTQSYAVSDVPYNKTNNNKKL